MPAMATGRLVADQDSATGVKAAARHDLDERIDNMPFLFNVEQKVKVKKPGHKCDGMVGRILYHTGYVPGNEPTQEVVYFGLLARGERPTFDSCVF